MSGLETPDLFSQSEIRPGGGQFQDVSQYLFLLNGM
jgi:hypothetical protein